MANLTHAELITPERVLFSGEAEAVVMRTDGGDITFLANHMDYIGAVDICVVRIQGVQQGAGSHDAVAPPGKDHALEPSSAESVPTHDLRAAVHGGFVMVADNKVTIVAGVAELAEEIDLERAERALQAAEVAQGAGGESSASSTAEAELALEGLPPAGSAAAAALAVTRAKVRIEAAAQLMGNLSRM